MEQVSALAAGRAAAYRAGDAEGYAAPFAENAVLSSACSAFRIQGKEAIRADIKESFLPFPEQRS